MYMGHVNYHIFRNKDNPYVPYSLSDFLIEYPDVLEAIITENKKESSWHNDIDTCYS